MLLLVLETLSVKILPTRSSPSARPGQDCSDKAARAAGKRAYWLIPMFWPKASGILIRFGEILRVEEIR